MDAVSYWSTMDVLLAAGLWSHTLQLLHRMIQKDLARHVSAPQHGSLLVAMDDEMKWHEVIMR